MTKKYAVFLMTSADNGHAVYKRLYSHSLKRLWHAKTGEAVIAALDREMLVSSTFSHDGLSGAVFQPGPAAAGKTEPEIRRVLGNPAKNSANRTGNFVVEDGEYLIQEDRYPLTKFSGGKSAISKKQTSEKPQTHLGIVPQLMSRADLLRLVRQCAAPPDAAELVTLLLVAKAVARENAALADVLAILRRPRPIISITCPVKGFEEQFVALLDRGFILTGAVVRSNGYESFDRGELKANLNGKNQRRITCFQGNDCAPAHLDSWTMKAAVRNRPILCVGESAGVLPPKFVIAADLRLNCGPLTPELLRDTITAILGDLPDDALAAVDCSGLDLVDVAVAMRPGNTPRRAATLLKELAADKQNDHAQSGSADRRTASGKKDKRGEAVGSGSEKFMPEPMTEPTQHSRVPSIETLSGYGDAAVWATNLKSDLEDWRAEDLSWNELPSKILLSGPPGTGKTFFARALCNSLQLPLFCTSVSTWLRPGHLGDVISRMNKAFEEAQSSGPAILFIDEIDGIGARLDPSRDHADYWNALVNTLLEILDGVTSLNGVIVVGATNRPAHIDPALLRAGRLMPHIEVGLPDTAALTGILRHHLGDDLDAVVTSAPGLPSESP
ncbi:ATP-binding protein [Mesorhizobium sp. KR2-14]|uniref:ATP-binding protein n=1 Tax=Mesorhizobium sp. KR2-14 TaxID=3156610 RepID=UPI0032B558DE